MKFSYAKMDICCTEMENIINNIKRLLDDLIDCREQLNKSECWKGQASSAYQVNLTQFTQSFEDVYSELMSAVYYLKQTFDGYRSIDQKIIESAKGLGKGV